MSVVIDWKTGEDTPDIRKRYPQFTDEEWAEIVDEIFEIEWDNKAFDIMDFRLTVTRKQENG